MEDRLEAELHLDAKPSQPAHQRRNAEAVELGRRLVDDAFEAQLDNPELRALVQKILDGTEPLGGPLHQNMPQKFTPRHINFALSYIAGMKIAQIAEMFGCGYQAVYWTVRHPWTKKLKELIAPQNAVRVIDIRTRMDQYAGDLMDYLFEKTIAEADTEVVAKVTFGLLDRAGYSPVNKTMPVDARTPGALPLQDNQSALSRLARAMEESNRVNNEIMPAWIPPKPPEDGGGSVGTPDQSPSDESGPEMTPSGTSPL